MLLRTLRELLEAQAAHLRKKVEPVLSRVVSEPFTQQIMALALTAALVFYAPVGVFLVMLSGRFRRTLAQALERAAEERTAWLWLLALGPVVAITVAHPSPPDDLLRDLRVWRTSFDYRPLFWGSPGIQPGDYYLGFDWCVGWIDRLCGHFGVQNWSWLPVIMLDALAWGVTLALILRQITRQAGSLVWMTGVACVMLVWLTPNFTSRVLSGRPESFFALWALCAVAVESVPGVILWVAAGFMLSTWYWFFWIYAPAAALLLWRQGWSAQAWRTRLLAGGVVLLCGAVFWLVVSKVDYLGWFWHLKSALHNRIGSVGENEILLMGLLSPAFMGLSAIGFAAGISHRTLKHSEIYVLAILAILCAWFALPNMVRYTDSVTSLMSVAIIILASSAWENRVAHPPWGAAAAAGIIGTFIWTALTLGTGSRPLMDLHLDGAKPGEKVLTWYSRSTYDTLYLNPTLRVAPGFEVGFSRQDVQRQSFNLGKGKVDCNWIEREGVSWVIAPPADIDVARWNACLRLVRTLKDGSSVWDARNFSGSKNTVPRTR